MGQAHTVADSTADGAPWLSLTERDRRWSRARALMRDLGLDCLIVAGIRGRERYDGYLAGEFYEGVVVMPLTSDPVYVVTQAHRITLRFEKSNARITPWIRDARPSVRLFDEVFTVLRERSLLRCRIGVVGVDSRGPMEMEGVVPYDGWASLLSRAPKAQFSDVSEAFATSMLTKSAEELDVARAAARIGEQACSAMLDATHIGATDAEVYAAIIGTIHRAGAYTAHPHLLLRCGPDTFGWGPPNTFTSGTRPRTLADGDILVAEIFTCLAGIETQQEMTIALGSSAEALEPVAAVARASYEAGLAALRPGELFSTVCQEMAGPILRAGYWHLGPNVHTIDPHVMVDSAFRGIETVPDLPPYPPLSTVPAPLDGPVQADSLFILEPNPVHVRNRVLLGGDGPRPGRACRRAEQHPLPYARRRIVMSSHPHGGNAIPAISPASPRPTAPSRRERVSPRNSTDSP